MMVTMDALTFAKGHGTGNDFVILPDPDGVLPLTPELVAAVCDRRRGIGADGVLRVVRSAAVGRDGPEWFMDYWNSDGSLAEMCGNGTRVYARYLVEAGLVAGPTVPLLTRAGVVVAEVGPVAVAVTMPMPSVYGRSSVSTVDGDFPGTVATCGNPNLVCRVADPAGLALTGPLTLDREVFPAGANVEFVAATPGDATGLAVTMRVVERGSGETLSCGTAACAVAAVALGHHQLDSGVVVVDVPGGRLTVTMDAGECRLTGPAVIVAHGTVHPQAVRVLPAPTL